MPYSEKQLDLSTRNIYRHQSPHLRKMYSPEFLAKVISELRMRDELFERPRGLGNATFFKHPVRADYQTDGEFYTAFLHFAQDYDRMFKSLSPFGVSCLKETTRINFSRVPDIAVRGFKTYTDILWEIYHIDRTIRGDANWKLFRPPPGLNYSIENRVEWT